MKGGKVKISLFVKSPCRIYNVREIAPKNRGNYRRKVFVTPTENKKSRNGIFQHVLLRLHGYQTMRQLKVRSC